jgi:hypothetical protein
MIQFIEDTLLDLKLWIDGADWRSWLAHAVVAIPIAALFGVVPVLVLFAVRELEQLALEVAYQNRIHWLDHLLDTVAPVLAALLVVAL